MVAEIESKSWESEENPENTRNEEGLHVPNTDAFSDLMNLCNAVKSL